ncbi:amidase [Mesobacterium pallidum]|uniref:amidase n=1 Tax=Mesobacterium pallidum TaxID=2872037 RepID=UPI001EE38512|nr:amidase [Mesobacterium pallidum]
MIDPWRALMPYPPAPVASGTGPLDGLRLAVKDIYDVAGYPTSCGNPIKLAESGIKTAHAGAVDRLLKAGAVFAGKVQTDELAWSMTGRNPHFGPVVNPAAPDRITGGSSNGSAAAVAGNLADIALGSDTGGSIRAPASFCGLWGLRPTQGAAPLDGCMPLVPSFDTCGLFARDGQTLLRASSVLMGPDSAALAEGPPPLATDMMARVAPGARAAIEPIAKALSRGRAPLYSVPPETLFQAFDAIQSREVVATHGAWIEARQMPLGDYIRDRYARARQVTANDEAYWRAERARITSAVIGAIAGRAILAPVVHDAPIRADAGAPAHLAFAGQARLLLCLAVVAGLPQVVFPATRIDGAPMGLSLIGPPGSDLALIERAVQLVEEHGHE